ncbi:RNA polymerase sigma-70 factor [Fulvivirgaceae bacterium BMA10]|uniref:RNA polymerase sigma-70 factor n=1 Tax=Splendidivirga corallicola TaxID=3051826 RepID=A0ABT8KSH2_9BACT|nr:RNA polymerase sigma-70 factor [Fulvivirgaceae bacterium BMA10]
MNNTSKLENIKSGDVSSFEQIFRQYYQSLCLFALKYVKDPDDAEEIVQDVFVKIWQKKDVLDIAISLKSYLYQAVRNASLNHLKHIQVKLEYEKNLVNSPSRTDTADTVIASELEAKIYEAVHKLPPERKKIFLLNRNEGLKYREIADQLNISVKTVESQMGKALKFLRMELVDFLSIVVLLFVQLFERLWP